MPLETRSRAAAERLLLLTEAVAEAALAGNTDELGGLLQSRAQAIKDLATMDIDALSQAILDRVVESERDLFAILSRTQTELAQQASSLRTAPRQVKAFSHSAQPQGLLRTG